MAKKFLTDIDLSGQQLLNARIENRASAPSNPSVGQVYYNTTDDKEYIWTGEAWSANTFELQPATDEVLGGIKVGSNLSIDSNGILTLDETFTDRIDDLEDEIDNKQDTLTPGTNINITNNEISATIPQASSTVLGGIKIGAGLTINSSTGVVSTNAATWSEIQNKPSSLGTPITGGTKTKITYDENGLVTAGANLSASDIPDLSATYVAKNSAITGATKTKITYDAKGLVTGGADLAATDIPAIPLTKISDITVAAEEVNKLDGIESNVQTQLNNKLNKNTAITGATKTKITYDKNGLVTAGADLSATDIPDLSDTYIVTTEKGANNGVATLNNSGKLTQSQIPDGLLGNVKYGGTFNASGVCTLVDGKLVDIDGTEVTSLTIAANNATKYRGYYFIASADGTVASIQFKVGDWCISNGTAGWAKVDNTDAVTGVKGNAESTYRIGNVNITAANVGAVAANTAITGATKTKITYDSKGLVTAGADLAVSDIPDLSATYLAKAQGSSAANKNVETDSSGNVVTVTRKYTSNVGNGTATTYTLTHNLGTRDVIVQIMDNTTYEVVIADVVMATTNTVTITFATAPASNAYRVVIMS